MVSRATKSFRYAVSEAEVIRTIRHKARTNLGYLCREILGYKDIVDTDLPHGVMTRPLSEIFASCQGKDLFIPSVSRYMYIPREDTPGMAVGQGFKRKYGIFVPRSWQKTTINTIGGTVLCILNFPLSTNLIYHNAEEEAAPIAKAIIDHFVIDSSKDASAHTMLDYFPEYCLTPKELRACTRDGEFFHPLRDLYPARLPVRKEGTVAYKGLNSAQAGRHYDTIKFTDIVETKNSLTPTSLDSVARTANTAFELAIDQNSFLFVEGTTYDGDDWHERLMRENFFGTPENKRTWHFIYTSCYLRDVPGGQKYTPDERTAPWKRAEEDIIWSKKYNIVTKKGQRIPGYPVWSNRPGKPPFWSNEALGDKEKNEPDVFAYQQLLCPSLVKGHHTFPAERYQVFDDTSPEGTSKLETFVDYDIITTDFAELDAETSNDCVFTWASMLMDGRVVVRYIDCEKRNPEDDAKTGKAGSVTALLLLISKVRPALVLIEETSFFRGLQGSLHRIARSIGLELPIEMIKRPRKLDKKERIKGGLRLPFAQGRLLFSKSLPEHIVSRIKLEMGQFPKPGAPDDVIETLADIFIHAPESAKLEQYKREMAARLKPREDFLLKALELDGDVKIYNPVELGSGGFGGRGIPGI